MENLDGENRSNSEEMNINRNGETARLVESNSNSRPNYINVPSYFCLLTFFAIILYVCFVNGVSLFSFHPLLMTIGWLVLMSIAVNAITPGDLATEWMPIRLRSARHWVIQLAASLTVIAGFLVILSNKIINDKSHFVTVHAKLGLSSFVLMFGTMTGGLGALYSLKLKSYLAPVYTKLIHTSFGLITYCLGCITIILGLFSTWWKFGETLRYISMILVLIVALFTMLRPALKVYFRIKERLENLK